MRLLAVKLLDIFVFKNEKKLRKSNAQPFKSSKSCIDAFEQALPLIFENVLIDYVKSAFIDFNSENMMVPWIYLCYNKEFSSTAIQGGITPT